MKILLSSSNSKNADQRAKVSLLMLAATLVSECASPVVLLACFAIHQAGCCGAGLPHSGAYSRQEAACLSGLAHCAIARLARIPAALLVHGMTLPA